MHDTFDDIALILKLQKGEFEAFDQLYEKYSWKLYRLALKYLRSETDAEDLVQSVFLKVWLNHRTLKKDLSFKSFIFTIAYNEICNTFRKRSYRREFIEYSKSQQPVVQIEEESITYQKVLEQVLEMIKDLPEKQQDIFIKSRFEGKSSKDIAAEINLTPGAVDNYISKTLKILRKKMGNEDLKLILFFSLFLV